MEQVLHLWQSCLATISIYTLYCMYIHVYNMYIGIYLVVTTSSKSLVSLSKLTSLGRSSSLSSTINVYMDVHVHY